MGLGRDTWGTKARKDHSCGASSCWLWRSGVLEVVRLGDMEKPSTWAGNKQNRETDRGVVR